MRPLVSQSLALVAKAAFSKALRVFLRGTAGKEMERVGQQCQVWLFPQYRFNKF